MEHPDENLIDGEDLKLTSDELSAKALALVRSIGTAETEEAGDAIAAKAKAYFRRSVQLMDPSPKNPGPVLPLPSEVRWQSRHEQMNWEEIREEWVTLRTKIATLEPYGLSGEWIDLNHDLTRLKIFIEDFWPNQTEVVGQIRAERSAAKERQPPF